MGGKSIKEESPLRKRFVHQAKLALLEIAQTTVSEA